MNKLVAALVGFFIIFVFGACNTSSAVTEIPVVALPTETKFVLSTSTVQVIPTIAPLTPAASAQVFATQEAIITDTPESFGYLSYEDCGSNWDSETIGSWALCSGLENPITIMNVSGKTWQFFYSSFF